MTRVRVVPVKHGMSALIKALKEAGIKAKDISLHMHQGHRTTQNIENKNETTTLIVHAGNINKSTTLPLLNEE